MIYTVFVSPSLVPDLTRSVTREEYEAELAAEPLDEDGYPKPTWDELQSVRLDCTTSTWQGIVVKE